MTAEEADRQEVASSKRRTRWAGWGLGTLTLPPGLLLVSLVWLVMRAPPPTIYYSAEIQTPIVTPSGSAASSMDEGVVRMSVVYRSKLDPRCLASTQYFVVFENGSMVKIPGIRWTVPGASLDHSEYSASVPLGAPPGRAQFFIREAYNCGFQARFAESPRATFTILPRDPTSLDPIA